jgi:ketosteroid isomerase-like protein
VAPDNVEIQRRGYEHFRATGEVLEEIVDPEFVWDMSTFGSWPERQTYEGIEGMREFLTTWGGAWEDWELIVEEFHPAGDKVVAVVRQRGRAKATGLPVDMHFGQVWTFRNGKQLRMEMYATPEEALRAAGLEDTSGGEPDGSESDRS